MKHGKMFCNIRGLHGCSKRSVKCSTNVPNKETGLYRMAQNIYIVEAQTRLKGSMDVRKHKLKI